LHAHHEGGSSDTPQLKHEKTDFKRSTLRNEVLPEVQVEYEKRSYIGGFFTICGALILLSVALAQLVSITRLRKNVYEIESKNLSEDQLSTLVIDLKDYTKDQPFVFGFARIDYNFDVLNNPFFEFIVYEIDDSKRIQSPKNPLAAYRKYGA